LRAHLIDKTLRQAAARETARGSKSFYLAARFFPAELRQAAHAVYWFCRYTDDLVDEAASPEEARQNLSHWSEEVERALRLGSSPHPVLRLFLDAAHRFRIPAEFPLDLIEGMRMDANGVRYRTFAELRVFCYRVASVVGLMMSRVIGTLAPADAYATDLGIAMQLTNILRDIGEDLHRGRIYLPEDELEAFGYPSSELRQRRLTPRFVDLMRFQVERARRYYALAEPGIPLLHPDGRFAVQIAADVYRGILAEIERNGYDSFSRRAVVPGWKKYRTIARLMAAPVARYSAGRLAFWRAW
jgi:phytoene synthase